MKKWCKRIRHYIKELYKFEIRALIPRHKERISISKVFYIDRKCIKYIIDSRKTNRYDLEKIVTMFERMHEAAKNPCFDISNNNTLYSTSRVLMRIYGPETLLVIYQPDGKYNKIFNAYYRPTAKIKKKYKIK